MKTEYQEREREERVSVLTKGENRILKAYNTCKISTITQKNVDFNSEPSYHLYRACFGIVELESIDRDPSLFIAEITRVISSLFDASPIL